MRAVVSVGLSQKGPNAKPRNCRDVGTGSASDRGGGRAVGRFNGTLPDAGVEGADGPRGLSLQHSCPAVVDGSRVEFKGDRDLVNHGRAGRGVHPRETGEKVLITDSTPDW
jgi:hypothetical protein